MSSIGTGYDLAASTFSPDGRIFQVEYAQKAVDSSATIVSLTSKYGVVTAVDQNIVSKLQDPTDSSRISNVNDYIGLIGSGIFPDFRAMLDYVQGEDLKFLKENRQPTSVKTLAKTLAEYVHALTLGISRPFGAAAFLTSWDKENGPSLYCIEPSGLSYKYKAWSIGKNQQAAKTEIEKLGDTIDHMEYGDLVHAAVRILLVVRDQHERNLKIEAAFIGADTKGEHQRVPNLEKIEADVQARIEEEEDQDVPMQ
jgi:20S proteasome subunit alpha 7